MQMADLLDGQQCLLLNPAPGKQCWSNERFCQRSDMDIAEASFLEAKGYPPWTGSLIVHSHTQRHSVACHDQSGVNITKQGNVTILTLLNLQLPNCQQLTSMRVWHRQTR